MSSPFTPDQLASLSAQIDQQLAELQNASEYAKYKGDEHDQQNNPENLPAQWRAIEETTKEKENPRSFWRRFKQAARRDLCEEGGVLNAQYKKYRDLSNDAVLVSFGYFLKDMGFSGTGLEILAVATAVIVLHLGCTVICEED